MSVKYYKWITEPCLPYKAASLICMIVTKSVSSQAGLLVAFATPGACKGPGEVMQRLSQQEGMVTLA